MNEKMTPQDIPIETCREILQFIREKVGDELQVAVVIFDEEGHRQFGSSCQLCTSEIFFQIAGELVQRCGGEHDEIVH